MVMNAMDAFATAAHKDTQSMGITLSHCSNIPCSITSFFLCLLKPSHLGVAVTIGLSFQFYFLWKCQLNVFFTTVLLQWVWVRLPHPLFFRAPSRSPVNLVANEVLLCRQGTDAVVFWQQFFG
jgi:hypothetical protein